MNATPTIQTRNESVANEPLPVLDVHLLYEDAETGLRARRTVGRVQEQLQVNCQLKLWRFDLMREPALREIVAREMEAADLLVVSFHGANSLRGAIADHLEQWVNCPRSTPRALVFSQDREAAAETGSNELVEKVQASAGFREVDFFHYFEPAPVAVAAGSSRDDDRIENAASAIRGTGQPRAEQLRRYWGINE